MTAVIVAILIL